MDDAHLQIEKELKNAEEARARGNEGRARVCARRAAGIAAREFLARRGETVRTPSAYDLLGILAEDRSLSDPARQSARYLILRVDQEFKLPVNVDLIAVARDLCAELMK